MRLFLPVRKLYCLFLLVAWALALPVQGQTVLRVEGTVTDAESGEALIGVSVVQKGTTNGTSTDVQGRYVLSVPQGATLVVNYLGYETTEVTAGSATLNIRLKAASNVLEDVVVIGYGSVRRKDVTTAISTVTTEDLDRRPIVSAGQAIQGRAAGVSVIQPNGAPGAEMSIRVRGATSFNGSNDPLYVVDGVPVDNIRFLAPNDIASMQILKDASSAAIYGSRAANGVILISTRAGRAGDAKIAFNAQYTQNRVTNQMDVLNTAQYTELQREIGAVTLPDGLTDQTNWFDETYQTGTLENYQLSVSDGTEKLSYLVSGGYVKDKGILNSSFFKRYHFRANVDNKVRNWLNIGANINYSDYSDNGVTTGLGANRGGVVLSVINTPTYAPIWNPENPRQYYNNFYGANNITSPLENLGRGMYNKNRENRLLASGNALITFLPRLTLKSSLTLDRRNAVNTTFLDPISTAWGRNQFGEASDNRNINTVLTFDNVLTFNRSFDKHNLEAMAGTSWTDSKYSNSWINGSHFRSDQIQTLNVANKISWNGTGSGGSDWAIMSYFARASYNFDSKYLLTANLRADGSSKLHPDHRWGYFPSVSAAWRLSSEDFMKRFDWINDLKIRAGWGETGNQSGVGDYSYLELYSLRRIEWFQTGNENALPTVSVSNLVNPDLTWETTRQTNVGLDLTALRNRLTLTLDYYHKRTTDMLMYVTLPAGQIANSIIRNEGVMTNKGFEVGLNSRNMEGDFSWTTDFNISFNKNKLEELELTQIYTAARTSDFIAEDVVRNVAGRPLGGFYGYISDGVDPETGDMMYRDLNQDGKISSTDRTYIGDPNPDFIFGLTNNFSWKNFDLSVFLQGSYGNDIFNASRIETEGMYDAKNQSARVLERWRVPGQITDVPRAGFDLRNSSYFVEDGSYLRVKNVSLSYNIGGDALRKLKIRRLQPYISVSNLLTWTNYSGMDPEVNQWGNSGAVQGLDWGTYPQSKSFVLGVNVEF